MNLKTSFAEEIIQILEDAQDVGLPHVVVEMRPDDAELQPFHLAFFDKFGAAIEHCQDRWITEFKPGIDESKVYYREVEELIDELNHANNLKKEEVMNRNNWENIQDEMKQLRFSPAAIELAREQMEKGKPEFIAYDNVHGNKNQVDVFAQFKQSGQSDNYYLSKFDVALNVAKPLEEGHKYFVITPNKEQPGKNLTKSFQSPIAAITFFKSQKGESKLVEGKDAAHGRDLATMKGGKVDYVEKGFATAFRTPAQTQTFYVDRGNGFTVEQAANLIQGRAVLRDDLVNLGGDKYAAWVKLDFDTPKDKYQNYQTNHYHVPSYGFTTKEALEKYNIKELADPEKAEKLMKSIENGNRPLITTVKDGQEVKLHMEASPRYRQLNFFQENGRIEKREQFLKEPQQDQKLNLTKSQGKEQEQGMGV